MSQPILLRVEALCLTKACKSSFPAGVFPATGDPAAPTCRALLSLLRIRHTVYNTQTHRHTYTHTHTANTMYTHAYLHNMQLTHKVMMMVSTTRSGLVVGEEVLIMGTSDSVCNVVTMITYDHHDHTGCFVM